MKTVLQILLVCVFITYNQAAIFCTRPAPYVGINVTSTEAANYGLSKSYYISAQNETADADNILSCCMSGYERLNIETDAENEGIKKMLAHYGLGGLGFWTGGLRSVNSNTWFWRYTSSNIAISYTDWNLYAHEPDMPSTSRACIGYASGTALWFDSECLDGHRVICER